jgi:acyl-CoA synthetase (AMP-forming)/AMP-acid ligase II
VAVVGVPHELGEVLQAWSCGGPVTASADELVAWTRSGWPGSRCRRTRFVDELPKGGTGKVLKHVLR